MVTSSSGSPPRMIFSPGEVVMTSGFVNCFGSKDIAETTAIGLVGRHLSGEFGIICEDDVAANKRDIKRGGQILSKYEVGITHDKTVMVYVITGPGHAQTTLLLPSER